MTLEERFWSKVDKNGPGGCWLWTASTRNGYGEFRMGSRRDNSRRSVYAHRVSWEIHYGPIPEGMYVLHKCDNQPCIHPEHLFLGAQIDNVADMMRKKRGVTSLGGGNGQAKLTTEDILQIRRLTNIIPQHKISKLFKVSKQQVSKIVNHEQWRHV